MGHPLDHSEWTKQIRETRTESCKRKTAAALAAVPVQNPPEEGVPDRISPFLGRVGRPLDRSSDADPSHLRSRHVESQPRSMPEQYIHMGDGARHLRRSPRYDLTRLPRGATPEETTRLVLGA